MFVFAWWCGGGGGGLPQEECQNNSGLHVCELIAHTLSCSSPERHESEIRGYLVGIETAALGAGTVARPLAPKVGVAEVLGESLRAEGVRIFPKIGRPANSGRLGNADIKVFKEHTYSPLFLR
jgi:hypothetical protein